MLELVASLGGMFLAGLSMGSTACVLHCAPVLFYVGGTADGWRQGLRSVLVFSFARLIALTVLGAFAGAIGGLFFSYLLVDTLATWLRSAAALIVILLGVFVLTGWGLSKDAGRICRALVKARSRGGLGSMALLGFLIGLTPLCPVVMGLLNYVAFGLESSGLGALYLFTFGLGSALVTPLLVIGPLVGWTSRLFTSPVRLQWFRRASGAILLLFGMALILRG